MADVATTLNINAKMNSTALAQAYDELVRLNEESLQKRRQAEAKLQGDIDSYASEGARNVARYMRDSVNDQINQLVTLQKEREAFSATAMTLDAQVRSGGLGMLTHEQQQEYVEILRARESLYSEHVKRQTEMEAEAAKERVKIAKGAADAIGFAGGLLARTSQGGPGENAMQSTVSGIKDVASSAASGDLLGVLTNTAKTILTVIVDFYNEDKRRTQQQVQAAGGSQQFQRYFQEAGRFEQAKAVQARLEHSTGLTVEEQKAVPAVQMAMQRSGQGAVDVSSREFETQYTHLAKTAMVLGQELTKFGGTIGEISRRTGEKIPEVIQAFARAGSYIDEYNAKNPGDLLNKIQFVDTVEQVTKALKDQKYALGDATAIALHWAKEIDKGTISVQEIVGAMKGMHAADPGTQAFMLQTAIPKMVETLRADMTRGLTGKEKEEQGAAADKLITLLTTGDLTRRLGTFRALSAGLQGSAFHKEQETGASEESMRRFQRTAQRSGAAALRERVRALNPTGNPFLKEQLENTLAPGFGINLQGKNYNEREAALRGLPPEEAFGKEGRQLIPGGPGGTDVVLSRQKADEAIIKSEGHLDTIRNDTKSIWNKIKDRTIGSAMVTMSEREAEHAKTDAMSASQREVYFRRQLALSGEMGEKARARANSPEKLNQYFKEFGQYPSEGIPSAEVPNIHKAMTQRADQQEADRRVASGIQQILVGVDPNNGVVSIVKNIKSWVEKGREENLQGAAATSSGEPPTSPESR